MDRAIKTVVDEELHAQSGKACCFEGYLSGVIRGGAELVFTAKGFSMFFRSKDELLIQSVSEAVYRLSGEEFEIEKSFIDAGYIKDTFYTLRLPVETASGILERCGIVNNKCEILSTIPPALISSPCCRSAYLKGLFLSCGSLSAPKEAPNGISGPTKGGYHMEFDINSALVRDDIKMLIASHAKVEPEKILYRKGKSGIYIKNAEAISNFLASIGSAKGALKVQSIIISREMKNSVNRARNFDLSNIAKSVNTGEKQINEIELIEKTSGLDSLPPKVMETAILRRENPAASLTELGAMSNPPCSKSAVNHRLRAISQAAQELLEKSRE